MSNQLFHNEYIPMDENVMLYSRWGAGCYDLMPYIVTDWAEETMSWKKSCYVSTYLSGFSVTKIKGPSVEQMMNDTFANNFALAKFPVGSWKHIFAVSPKGNITGHGVCLRVEEDAFELQGSTLYPYIPIAIASGRYEGVRQVPATYPLGCVFQLAGPRALEIVEHVIRRDIHDLAFTRFTYAEVLGHPVRVVRLGMGGTMSYEIQGAKEHSQEIFAEIMRVGKEYDIKRLGHLAYMCNHTENGFPQNMTHFMPAYSEDPEIFSYNNDGNAEMPTEDIVPLRGSMADRGSAAYYANPFETGWQNAICWSKDFRGRDALMKLKEAPDTRSLCTLEWNGEDILNIFRAYLDDEEGFPDKFVFPQNFLTEGSCLYSDQVLNEKGEFIGRSSGVVYTPYYKRVISQCYLDRAYNELGREVTVLWGRPGTRQIPIRAKVTRTPYLDLAANSDFDSSSIPRYSEEK